jgi:hypothetical protein
MVIRPPRDGTGNGHADHTIIGRSTAQQVIDQVELVAPTDSTVLILGGNRHREGTGRPPHTPVHRVLESQDCRAFCVRRQACRFNPQRTMSL